MNIEEKTAETVTSVKCLEVNTNYPCILKQDIQQAMRNESRLQNHVLQDQTLVLN